MSDEILRPRLIVVAGPNGAGKTSITEQLLRHEWMGGYAKRVALRVMEGGHDVPISKIIARYTRSLANCAVATRIADRAYIYDNSVDNAPARLLFRTSEGKLIKHYGDMNPWALEILREIDAHSLPKTDSD
jgi:predicted ABC-type ATPase